MNQNTKVEIARSFSYKLNCGNYESRDFFCSQKAEVELKDAEKTSEALYQFCKEQVMKAVNEYKNPSEPKELDSSPLLKKKWRKPPLTNAEIKGKQDALDDFGEEA